MAHRPTPQKLSPAVAIRSLAPTTLRQPYRRHRPIVRAPEAHTPEAAEAARCARLAGLGAPAWAAERTFAEDRRADRRTFCRPRRQNRPEGHGGGAERDLRGRLPRVLVWIPT